MIFFLRYLSLLFIALSGLSVYIPQRYTISYPKPLGPEFDEEIRINYLESLEGSKAEIVLMGDSTLGEAVDFVLLEQELKKEIMPIGIPGSAATLWYLIIKNNIIQSVHKPAYLILFIRDTVMTVPEYRTTGAYFNFIDEYSNSKDEILIQKAYTGQMSFVGKIAEQYLPVYGSRWRIRESIDFYIRYPLPKTLLDCNSNCMLMSMKIVFSQADIDEKRLSDALFAADTLLYEKKTLDFNKTVEKSFLPEIIRLTNQNNTRLIFVRIKTMRFPTEGDEPPELKVYFSDMQRYLDENGVSYLDFSRTQNITREHFSDNVHMNKEGKELFTPLLIGELKKLIE